MTNVIRGVMNKFNRGEVAEEAFAREDVERIDNSCEVMENFQPERLGPMKFRPGAELIDLTTDDEVVLVPFITEIDDPWMLIFSGNTNTPFMTVMTPSTDALLATNTNTSGFQNQFFTTGFAVNEWTEAHEGSATAQILAGSLELFGTGSDAAIVYQTTDTTDTGTVHTFKLTVTKHRVKCQIGSTGVGSSDLFEFEFGIGVHHVDVVHATLDITVTLSNDSLQSAWITSVELIATPLAKSVFIENGLDFVSPSTGLQALRDLRYAQSADVMFFCGKDWLPFVVKRTGDTSFSVERFEPLFGPYEPLNISNITMNPTAPVDGDMTVVATQNFFQNSAAQGFGKGTLLKLAIVGQNVTVTGTDATTVTPGVFVFGVGDARQFTIIVDTTGAYGSLVLQKSFDEVTWQNVGGPLATFTSGLDFTSVYNDGLDAAEIFYRMKVDTVGSMTTIDMTIEYDYGTVEAQGRIYNRINNTDVAVSWYVPLGVDQTVRDWYIGSWGGKKDWPTAVAIDQGRLWFAGGNRVWGSESDFFRSFNRNIEGASASIQRTIGFGSSKQIFWLAPSANLVAGTGMAEIDIRSDSFGGILTDLNTNLKNGSSQGCANVPPLVSDQEIVFVQRGGNKLIGIDFNIQAEKHVIEDFNMLNASILNPSVVRMAVVRNPETRIYLVLSDGTMRVLLRDIEENVIAWSKVTIKEHNGTSTINDEVTDVAVLPGSPEDRVYISVKTGATTGKLLRLAMTTEVDGGIHSKHFDSWQYFLSPGTTITLSSNGGAFANGNEVAVWADGVDRGDFTLNASLQITVPTAWTDVYVGYRYDADYKSNKLTGYDDLSVLASRKRIVNTGLIMKDYVAGVVTVGPETSLLGSMPLLEDGQVPLDGGYDFFPFEFSGISEVDPRIHIKATGPCNIMALAYDVKNSSQRTKKEGTT